LVQQPVGLTLAAHQADGVDVEDQSRFAALLGGLRIEQPDPAKIELGLVQPVRVLVQQKAKVGGWPVGCGDGEEHARLVA